MYLDKHFSKTVAALIPFDTFILICDSRYHAYLCTTIIAYTATQVSQRHSRAIIFHAAMLYVARILRGICRYSREFPDNSRLKRPPLENSITARQCVCVYVYWIMPRTISRHQDERWHLAQTRNVSDYLYRLLAHYSRVPDVCLSAIAVDRIGVSVELHICPTLAISFPKRYAKEAYQVLTTIHGIVIVVVFIPAE